jgi:uncharacterized cupredoxin-like copper-binding protein
VPGQALQRVKLLTAAGVLGALAFAGCGGSKPDLAKGKQLFTQRCGSCHTLADAKARGQIGPNLDDAFRRSLADGLGRDTVEGIVREQIAVPQGPRMPANLVRGDDARDVAAYVGSATGKAAGAGAAASSGASQQGGAAKANARNELQIPTDPTGQLRYEFSAAEARAGKVTLSSKNDASIPHDIAVKGNGVNAAGDQVSNGGTSRVTVTLRPGKYEFYCSVPGHEQAGMKGTLTVR